MKRQEREEGSPLDRPLDASEPARIAGASTSSAGAWAPRSSLQLLSEDLEPVRCLDTDLDLVPPEGNRGDDDLLARLTVDDEDFFVNAAGQ